MEQEIPSFATLYKIKNVNKIITWCVFIESCSNGTYNVVVTFGEVYGKKQVHKTSIEKGKANRTPLQQAILEAQSKWNEKKNRDGYSLEEPQILSSSSSLDEHTSVSDSNDERKKEIDEITPFYPMLAQTFDKNLYFNTSSRAFRISFPAFVQRKYDGIRCVASFNMETGIICFTSRKNTEFHNLDVLKQQLMPFYTDNNSFIILDGELYNHSLQFERINGIVRL